MTLKISNRNARRLWLDAQGLSSPPTGQHNNLSIIKALGYVQLDTLQIVSRAHHHIIWSRNQHYREATLNSLLQDERCLFEHYSHDACVLPMEFYPMWQRQFQRKAEQLKKRLKNNDAMPGKAARNAILRRIDKEGPLSSKDFATNTTTKRKIWTRPAHKIALDYLWYAGELATSYRHNFNKYYDLSERVIPDAVRNKRSSDAKQVDWLCRQALERLVFANVTEIQRFWEACDLTEAKQWVERNRRKLVEVEVQSADRTWVRAWALPGIEERLSRLQPPTSRLRILNPFDPIIRDRARLLRLFDFDYRIEIYVPAAKRRWGYYVFPILEGDRMCGRIEVRANRRENCLTIVNFWAEPNIKWSRQRTQKLTAELKRMARFTGVEYAAGDHGMLPSG